MTTPMLTADGALAAARAYCGWHVTPQQSEDIVIDGPGGPLLALPTLQLADITALTENGVQVDVDTLEWSTDGLVRKGIDYPGAAIPVGWSWFGWWECGHITATGEYCWTNCYRGITATITHGFVTAPDFSNAVASAMNRVSGGGREVVGPFTFAADTTVAGSAFSAAERAVLDLYRLERAP